MPLGGEHLEQTNSIREIRQTNVDTSHEVFSHTNSLSRTSQLVFQMTGTQALMLTRKCVARGIDILVLKVSANSRLVSPTADMIPCVPKDFCPRAKGPVVLSMTTAEALAIGEAGTLPDRILYVY